MRIWNLIYGLVLLEECKIFMLYYNYIISYSVYVVSIHCSLLFFLYFHISSRVNAIYYTGVQYCNVL